MDASYWVSTYDPYHRQGFGYDAEVDVVELPVTIEEEAAPPLADRLPQALAVADRIARYGGVVDLIIHPDVAGAKLAFERVRHRPP